MFMFCYQTSTSKYIRQNVSLLISILIGSLWDYTKNAAMNQGRATHQASGQVLVYLRLYFYEVKVTVPFTYLQAVTLSES